MFKRLAGIVLIFCGAGIAWFVLGATLLSRTMASDSSAQQRLGAQWGTEQTQSAPEVTFCDNGAELPVQSSRIGVDLRLEQRRKGLLWYNLYDVRFSGRYVVRNDGAADRLVLRFPLPDTTASYADVVYRIGGRSVDSAAALGSKGVAFDLAPGRSTVIELAYRSRGMQSWTYRFGEGMQAVRDFDLTMATDFKSIDFPPGTLLPVSEEPNAAGWRLGWRYATLVTNDGIGMTVPYPLQPGPLAQRITFWAPVALLFYFFVMVLSTTLRGIELHPINYFFLAAAFFAFHLLFAYLVDRIPIEAAFVICSAVSMFLTISYLQLVVGWRFAAIESGCAQLVYLVLFSYALFNEGWSGLTITVGAIATLFAAMQLTGRIRWRERLATP